MSPPNSPSMLAKIKTRDSIGPNADSFYVPRSAKALVPLAAAQSTLKSTCNVSASDKSQDSLVGDEEEECQTPKSEEHKVPQLLCCPPAPCKPTSLPVKRKLPSSPPKEFYILSDSDLQSLFGSDLAKIGHQHMKKKQRSILPKYRQ